MLLHHLVALSWILGWKCKRPSLPHLAHTPGTQHTFLMCTSCLYIQSLLLWWWLHYWVLSYTMNYLYDSQLFHKSMQNATFILHYKTWLFQVIKITWFTIAEDLWLQMKHKYKSSMDLSPGSSVHTYNIYTITIWCSRIHSLAIRYHTLKFGTWK